MACKGCKHLQHSERQSPSNPACRTKQLIQRIKKQIIKKITKLLPFIIYWCFHEGKSFLTHLKLLLKIFLVCIRGEEPALNMQLSLLITLIMVYAMKEDQDTFMRKVEISAPDQSQTLTVE